MRHGHCQVDRDFCHPGIVSNPNMVRSERTGAMPLGLCVALGGRSESVVITYPTALKVQLQSQSIHAIRLIRSNVVEFCQIISFIYTTITHPVSYRPNILIR